MSTTTARLDALQAALPKSQFARQLSFDERCAVYYLVKRGFRQKLIGLAFGVTQAAVSRLARADGQRYASVIREYQRLGHDAFGDRYYTGAIETRLMRHIASVPTAGDLAQRKFGPDAAHRKAAGQYLIRDIGGAEVTAFIFWRDGEGWAFRQDDEPGPYLSAGRYMTSTLARKAMLENYAIDREDILAFIPEA